MVTVTFLTVGAAALYGMAKAGREAVKFVRDLLDLIHDWRSGRWRVGTASTLRAPPGAAPPERQQS